MPDFSRPPSGPGAPQPKIPETVPLEKTDEHRQAVYGPLAATSKDTEKLDLEEESEPSTAEPEVGDIKRPEFEPPSEDDRKAFLSALLGGKQYEKRFALFGGGVTVKFRDRTTKDTEAVLAILRRLADKEHMTQDDYDIIYDRYMLVIQFVEFNDEEHAIKELEADERNRELLDKCVQEWLLSMPRPVYHAVLQAFRQFENENAFMTEHALDSDFWKPDGPASAPRRTPAALSTTGSTRGMIRTGS
jgi:hypothetical protein